MIMLLVVGASGVGKDTLLSRAREQLSGQPGFYFIRRYITRFPDVNEGNYFIDSRAFDLLKAGGFFVAHWKAHGNCYGIPHSEIPLGVDPSSVVIMSVSRQVVPEIERRFSRVITINISAHPDILRQRLLSRGREDVRAIEKRLAREVTLEAQCLINFDNSSPLEIASERFTKMLKKMSVGSPDFSSHYRSAS